MRILAFGTIREYFAIHSNSEIALRDWHNKTKKSEWNCLGDIKKTFKNVDYVPTDKYIFNIKGKHYRLVAKIVFRTQTVYILFIGTHAEYDKIDCSTI